MLAQLTPRAFIARIAGVMGRPVTDTTDAAGRPWRTLSSTMATTLRPRSASKDPFIKLGGRRVTQVVRVTFEISSSN